MTSDAPAPAVVVHAATASPGVVGGVATAVIDALKTSPVLLLIVLLNAAFCGAAAYYLLQVEAYRHKERVEVIDTLRACMNLKSTGARDAEH